VTHDSRTRENRHKALEISRHFSSLRAGPCATRPSARSCTWVTKLLQVKGSGAETRAEGPFLKWQNHGSNSTRRERRPHPPLPLPSKKEGAANELQL